MERREFRTPVGSICLWSDFASHDPTRPLVLVIRGALPAKHDLEWLRPAGADIVFAHLPGFHCPLLVNDTVGVMIFAFDQVISSAFEDRRVILLGVSTGALVACGLQSASIAARILVEPFFSTGDLQPLHVVLHTVIQSDNLRLWQWCQTVLGMAPSGIENRDYAQLLRGDRPLIAIVGDDPLRSDWKGGFLPSLTSDVDRQRLKEAGSELIVTHGGHEVPKNDPQAITSALEAMIRRVDGPAGTLTHT